MGDWVAFAVFIEDNRCGERLSNFLVLVGMMWVDDQELNLRKCSIRYNVDLTLKVSCYVNDDGLMGDCGLVMTL